MSASTDLTTIAKVKSYAGDTSLDDVLLASLIDSVSEAIERHCNREFNYEAVTEYHDGRGESFVMLDRVPVDTGETFQIWDDTGRDYEAADLVDADDYVVYPKQGRVQLDAGAFADGNRNVKVSFTGGHSTIPPAVEQAANMLVMALYTRGTGGGDGIKSETLGRHAITWAESEEMPPVVKTLLATYRRPGL